jgi:hypothetical protein
MEVKNVEPHGRSVTMRLFLTGVLTGGIFLFFASCATVPTEPLASGELRLLSMKVPKNDEIRVNLPLMVNISFEADGKPEIRTACFYFSGDGPYCLKAADVNYGSPGTIKIQVRASTSGSYLLECYILYIRDGKLQPSNVIATHVHVISF